MSYQELKQFFKELFSAYYDTETKKIHNCRYGSIIWNHEDRHRQQFKFAGDIINTLTAYTTIIAGAFVILAFINWNIVWITGAGLIYTPVTLIWIYLEVDAWIYAIRTKIKQWVKKW